MNIKQKLLFARVGFTPAMLEFLSVRIGDKISERGARAWASGEKMPKNPYYLQTAYRLDSHLTKLAYRIVSESDGEQIVLPYYINNDDYWAKTNDTSCFVSVYYQLLQRIEILSDKPVVYDNNIATLAVNFDLTL